MKQKFFIRTVLSFAVIFSTALASAIDLVEHLNKTVQEARQYPKPYDETPLNSIKKIDDLTTGQTSTILLTKRATDTERQTVWSATLNSYLYNKNKKPEDLFNSFNTNDSRYFGHMLSLFVMHASASLVATQNHYIHCLSDTHLTAFFTNKIIESLKFLNNAAFKNYGLLLLNKEGYVTRALGNLYRNTIYILSDSATYPDIKQPWLNEILMENKEEIRKFGLYGLSKTLIIPKATISKFYYIAQCPEENYEAILNKYKREAETYIQKKDVFFDKAYIAIVLDTQEKFIESMQDIAKIIRGGEWTQSFLFHNNNTFLYLCFSQYEWKFKSFVTISQICKEVTVNYNRYANPSYNFKTMLEEIGCSPNDGFLFNQSYKDVLLKESCSGVGAGLYPTSLKDFKNKSVKVGINMTQEEILEEFETTGMLKYLIKTWMV